MTTRYWIGVVSLDHVQNGIETGFAQLAQGEELPLKRMKTGDWLIYYSSRPEEKSQEPYQAFTAVARMIDSDVYSVFAPNGFVFFRRNARYFPCHHTAIKPLIEKLSFIVNKKRWGFPFRTGHFEITPEDFEVITSAMGLDAARRS
jgi:predicted RNA-binding protein